MTNAPETAPQKSQHPDAEWWRDAVVYQVYPRSFADANGDGIGDFRGVIDRIPYLQKLGIDAIWFSPFYPSALADGGYDVDDYRAIDPRIGTLEEFDEMTEKLHAAGIRVIVDIVPNHTSDQHEWFRAALAAEPGSPERDRYIFRDGEGVNGEQPPSNWQSIFGGPMWERVPDGQWYLHIFAKEQPDLNWENPEVRKDFEKTIRFWSDRGVDGFRIDVAHGLAKNLETPLPHDDEIWKVLDNGQGPIWDRDEVHEVYRAWRQIFNEYDPPRTAVAEAWVHPDRRASYASPEGLGQAFNFDLLETDFDRDQFREIIERNITAAAASGSSSTWVFSNHDVVRHPTRYGLPKDAKASYQSGKEWLHTGDAKELDRDLGLRKARAATQLMLALPGSVYIYQGEELGLHEVTEIAPDERQDPTFFRTNAAEIGRDGCRVPLPWTPDGPSFGFGPGGSHLPQPKWFADVAASAQDGVAGSTLEFYRAAIALRHELQTGADQSIEFLPSDDGVLAFRRSNGWTSVTNFGPDDAPLPVGDVVLASDEIMGDVLPAFTTVWLR